MTRYEIAALAPPFLSECPPNDARAPHALALLDRYVEAIDEAADHHPRWAGMFVWHDRDVVAQGIEVGLALLDGDARDALEWFQWFGEMPMPSGMSSHIPWYWAQYDIHEQIMSILGLWEEEGAA